MPSVLVIDIGGTGVKLLLSGQSEPTRFESGEHLTPAHFLDGVRGHSAGWRYDAVSIGYPGRVRGNRPADEPGNLADGWVDFDYEAAFGRPVRFLNDAAMQALGAYDGGRMLFLGLGTGLGSALVADHVVVPLELGRLSFDGEPLGERLGKAGFGRDAARWKADVGHFAHHLRDAFEADEVVLGGGNAKEVDPLPEQCRRGGNADAFEGGFKLWAEPIVTDLKNPGAWRVVG